MVTSKPVCRATVSDSAPGPYMAAVKDSEITHAIILIDLEQKGDEQFRLACKNVRHASLESLVDLQTSVKDILELREMTEPTEKQSEQPSFLSLIHI